MVKMLDNVTWLRDHTGSKYPVPSHQIQLLTPAELSNYPRRNSPTPYLQLLFPSFPLLKNFLFFGARESILKIQQMVSNPEIKCTSSEKPQYFFKKDLSQNSIESHGIYPESFPNYVLEETQILFIGTVPRLFQMVSQAKFKYSLSYSF